MNKTTSYIAATAMGIFALSFLPLITQAESLVEVEASAEVGAQVDGRPSGSIPGNVPALIRQRIMDAQSGRDGRGPNGEKPPIDRDLRNELRASTTLKARLVASTTPGAWMRASTTARMEDRKEARDVRHEDRNNARLDIFSRMQKNLVDQATRALDNLKQIRARIATRIDTAEQNGRTMTDAKAKLVMADTKIVLAENAVASLAAFTPTTTVTASSTIAASTTIALKRPRELGKNTIDAINAARRALQDVVIAIAHNMGLKIGDDGKIVITATTTATTTTP